MAGPDQALLGQLARFQLDPGNIFSDLDIDLIGDSIVGALARLLLLANYDVGAGESPSAVLGEYGGGSGHLLVEQGVGQLDYTVQTGMGFISTPGNIESTPFVPDEFLPVILRAAASGTLAAHDPALPRIDVVAVSSATLDSTGEHTEGRLTRDPISGDIADPSPEVDIRRSYSGAVSVIEGTPAAEPVAPAAGPGVLVLAHILVPATTGPVVVHDRREFFQAGQLFRGSPPRHMVAPHVIDGCGLSKIGPFETLVAEGAYHSGDRQRYTSGESVVHPSPGPGLIRQDLITFDTEGALTVVQGVAGGADPPADAVLPAGYLQLAQVRTTVSGTSGFEGPERVGPIGPMQLQEAALVDRITTAHVEEQTRWFTTPGTGFGPGDSATSNYTGLASWSNDVSGVTLGRDGSPYFFTAPAQLPHGATLLTAFCTVFATAGVPATVFEATLLRVSTAPGAGSGGVAVFTVSGSTAANAAVRAEDLAPGGGLETVDAASYTYSWRFEMTPPVTGPAINVRMVACGVSVSTRQLLS